MPFVPVPNTAEVCWNHRIAGQKMQWCLHFEKGSAFTQTELESLAEDAIDAWIANIKGQLSTVTSLVSVIVRDLTSQTAPAVEVAPSTAQAGTQSGSPTPAHTALAIKKLTALRGRSYRGRVYFGGFNTASMADAHNLSTAARDAFVAALEAVSSTLANFGTYTPVVVSKYSGVDGNGDPIPRAAGVTTAITGYAADTTLDSQRRRLQGRGD